LLFHKAKPSRWPDKDRWSIRGRRGEEVRRQQLQGLREWGTLERANLMDKIKNNQNWLGNAAAYKAQQPQQRQ